MFCLCTVYWEGKNSPLYKVAGCPLFRGFKFIKKWSGVSELSITSWVSTVEGCLLTGVRLYLSLCIAYTDIWQNY